LTTQTSHAAEVEAGPHIAPPPMFQRPASVLLDEPYVPVCAPLADDQSKQSLPKDITPASPHFVGPAVELRAFRY